MCGHQRIALNQLRGSYWVLRVSDDMGRLTAELEAFEPANDFALIVNDLRLPYQGNGHEAHRNNAKAESDADDGLVSRKAENAAKPRHANESPGTPFDTLTLVRSNPNQQRLGAALA